jgi:hypothetical protein
MTNSVFIRDIQRGTEKELRFLVLRDANGIVYIRGGDVVNLRHIEEFAKEAGLTDTVRLGGGTISLDNETKTLTAKIQFQNQDLASSVETLLTEHTIVNRFLYLGQYHVKVQVEV